VEPIAVRIHADDPILRTGVVGQLRSWPEVRLLDSASPASVALVVCDRADARVVRLLRTLCDGGTRPVLVAADIDDAELVSAAEAGVAGMVRRGEATAERLVAAIRAAAAGEGSVPPDLLARLLDQVGRLHRRVPSPRGPTVAGLAEREIDVLRLLAEGLGTVEIAEKLGYSERTVKNVLHGATVRLRLRNRCHAVAYALRRGVI
jgi:DNA-binding NarL/FixJ family response regulator